MAGSADSAPRLLRIRQEKTWKHLTTLRTLQYNVRNNLGYMFLGLGSAQKSEIEHRWGKKLIKIFRLKRIIPDRNG